MAPDRVAYWRRQDAWTMRELAVLCVGEDPSSFKLGGLEAFRAAPDDLRAYHGALDKIRRAVVVGALTPVEAWTSRWRTEDKIYDEDLPFVQPSAPVLSWAAKHFAAFPCGDEITSGTNNQGMPERLARLVDCALSVLKLPPDVSQKQASAEFQEKLGMKQRGADELVAWLRPGARANHDRRSRS